MINKKKELKLAVIGLGYVGLPLALEFAKKRKVIGFDVNKQRIKELKSGFDRNLETTKSEIKNIKKLNFTNHEQDLEFANCYIITVPTPIDKFKKPDLTFLLMASKTVGGFLKEKDLVIYESTVYPGCIEEVCVPVLEKFSKLVFNKDFFCGYSPERINPGDKKHTISKIKKITSGSTPKITNLVDALYNEIITVGTHKAPSIKVAEAAKVIENTQRDLNIALINELSIIFRKMNIETEDVLKAAETKWNFLPFKPGLVGGHCIGVDPYYLTYKAKRIGYQPKVILSGRRVNDKMSQYVANEFIKQMKKKQINIKKSKILIMGLTFKENCADIRNSGVKKIYQELKKYKCKIDIHDPWANVKEVKKEFGITPILKLGKHLYDGVMVCVAHKKFKEMKINKILHLCKQKKVIFDLKSLFEKNQIDFRL